MIHTRIDKPLALRKELLEAAIDSTDILKSYEKFKQFEADRRGLKVEMKTLLGELQTTTLQFEQLLPAIPAEFLQEEKKLVPAPTMKVQQVIPGQKFVKQKQVLPRQGLDDEILEIRKKLLALRQRV